MYKGNSFLDYFRATSGPETIDSSAVTEVLTMQPKASNTTRIPYRKTPPMSEVQKQQAWLRKTSKICVTATEELHNSVALNSTHQGKAAVPKVTVAAEVEVISRWILLHRAVS